MEISQENSYSMYLLNFIFYGFFICVIGLISSHIISRICLMLRSSVKLVTNSFVVITGGCMGIGKQMAIQIAKLYHCKIMIVDIRKQLFPIIKQALQQQGSTVQCHYCDLADDKSVDQFIEKLNKQNKNIDLFIHNAGVHIPKKALETSEQEFMMQYKVNFISPVKIIKKTIDLLSNGHIGIVASMTTLAHGGVDVSTYSSSKYALYSFVNCLRQQLKISSRNTTISMGCPYLITTGMFQGFKTHIDFIFKHLDPQYVGKRLVRQFIQKKQICYIYQYEALLFKIVNFFPTEFLDILSIKFNVSNFDGIRNKHDERINKKKS